MRSPKMPLRTEDQHHDQQGEGDQVAQLVGRGNADAVEEQRRADRLDHAEEQPAEHGARDVADAAEHRRRRRP